MKLTATVKLQPSPEQANALRDTLERANDAANYASEWAWQNRTCAQYSVHKAIYYRLRDLFSLSAQLVVGVIAKVSDAYKIDKKRKRVFRKHGSIVYDSRVLNWYQPKSLVTGRISQCSARTVSPRCRAPGAGRWKYPLETYALHCDAGTLP